MASKCGEESGATAFCLESNREGTNILVVKGTTHTGMKDICIDSIMIVSLDDYMCRAPSAVMAISKFEFVPSS